MTINLTIVVQMAHFLIAYFLITKFLLRPGYEAVKSDENRLRQLRALMISEQEKLAEKQEYKRRRWQVCQNYFYQNRPNIEPEEFRIKTLKALEPLPEMSSSELLSKAKEITSKLYEKVIK